MPDPVSLPCIFCRGEASGSKSRGHIFPQYMGNTTKLQGEGELYIEPGLECDQCNHGPLSNVENDFARYDVGFLARFGLMKWKRLPIHKDMLGPVTFPSARGRTKSLTMIEPQWVTDEEAAQFPSLGSGQFTLRMGTKPHLTSAFLSKIFIEVVAKMGGREVALDPEFDKHRKNVLSPTPTDWLPFLRSRDAVDGLPSFGYHLTEFGLFVFTWGTVFCVPGLSSLIAVKQTLEDGTVVSFDWQRPECEASRSSLAQSTGSVPSPLSEGDSENEP